MRNAYEFSESMKNQMIKALFVEFLSREKQKLIRDGMLIYDICEHMNAFSSFATNLIR